MKHEWIKRTAVMMLLIILPVQALAYGKLEKGAAGADVLVMQTALQSLGYSIAADGKFGPATVSAVKSFQRQHGLQADGIAGDKTLTLLYALVSSPGNEPAAVPPAASPSPFAARGSTATVATGGAPLNLRQYASSGAKVIVTIPDGEKVIVYDQGSGWASVAYEGVRGYVMASYLSFDGAVTRTPAPVLTPAPILTPAPAANAVQALVVTTGGSLNLREAAGTGGKVKAQIPYGAWVSVNVKGDTWSYISYNGMSGYVMSRYLSFGTSLFTPAPAASPTAAPAVFGETAMVSTSGGTLNLREYARSNAKVILTIPNGTAVAVSAKGDPWCAVSYQGVAGYVMTSFLRFPSDPAQVPTPTAQPTAQPTPEPATPGVSAGTGMVTTSGGSVNLRAQASSGAKVLGSVPNAGIVTIHARGPEWTAVTYNGTFGYIMSQYITLMNAVPAENGETEEDDPSAYKRTLKKGMTGEDVTWVQHRLDELGYALHVTNIYDDATYAAVKSFQSQNGLDADGLAGAQTFAVLKSENARRAGAQPLTYAVLRVDQSGDGVKQLQTDLKALGYPVTVNGTFDTDTHNAVVAFQQRNGLVISGIADALTRQVIHSGRGKPYSTAVAQLPANEGWMASPATSQVKLLHWQNEIKPYVKTGQTFTVLDPNTNLSWKLVFYSLGRHADCQPASWRDTQIMNRSFGGTSWTIHPVYVLLPSGQWTLATMHNRPHLYGSIADNGFGGHLCVHFLRDMAEARKNDPNYGVNNQITLRSAWKALTGETVD